jgi:UPF0716 protein FxsA
VVLIAREPPLCDDARMAWLILLFILVPAVELGLLIELGSRVGTLATLGLIVVTGVVGAALARHQGFQVLRRVQAELGEGRLPAGPLVDGVIILLAGALLLTPGLLTDVLGFLFLMPGFRGIVKRMLREGLARAAREQRVHLSMHLDGFEDPRGSGPVYDLEVDDSQDRPPEAPGRNPR